MVSWIQIQWFPAGARDRGNRAFVVYLSKISDTNLYQVCPAYPITRSVIEPNRTPIVRLGSVIEHNRTHSKLRSIEQNRTFNYRTIDNRTQSNVRLPNSCLFLCGHFKRCTVALISPARFTYQKTDYEQNRIGFCSIVFDWFESRSHSKEDVRFCLITEPNRTIDVRLGSIDFWFDFAQLDTPGVCDLRT